MPRKKQKILEDIINKTLDSNSIRDNTRWASIKKHLLLEEIRKEVDKCRTKITEEDIKEAFDVSTKARKIKFDYN